MKSPVRLAAVAGMFYPDDPRRLDAMVRGYLDAVMVPADAPPPKAIIAPHAGYMYSGAVAAIAYARWKPIADRIRRVVLLGPCHRVAVDGIAASSADAFETPLGRVAVDTAARDVALALPQVRVMDATHAEEHSLEVHLPFLQRTLSRFAILPLVVGRATPAQVAEVLEQLWGGEETRIVISSDLSHHLDYDTARAVDGRTCAAIEALEPAAIGSEQACGRVPVAGLLTSARRRGLSVTTLDLRSSGDTAGPRDRVVGYGAWMFTETGGAGARETGATGGRSAPRHSGESPFEARTRALIDKHGPTMLHLAAAAVEHAARTGQVMPVETTDYPADLQAPGAAFVTLERDGQLRGCIGSPKACRPLIADVVANATGASLKDSRFSAVTLDECPSLSISVSVLSPREAMLFVGEDHLLEQLRPGIDGLIIESGGRRALFLPQVWNQIPEPAVFLTQLKRKAGLAADHWSGGFRAWRFTALSAKSVDLEDPAMLWTPQPW